MKVTKKAGKKHRRVLLGEGRRMWVTLSFFDSKGLFNDECHGFDERVRLWAEVVE